MMMDILNTVTPALLSAHAHAEGESHGVLREAWEIITDPGHAIAEIFFNILDNLIIVPVTVYVYKKFREPKLRRQIHQEIDTEHGIDHDDCHGNIKSDEAKII